jgi:plastocyanin
MGRQRSFKLGATAGLFGVLMVAGSALASSTASVKIGEANNRYAFTPVTAYVNVGGTVSWMNGSDAPHTVTSDSGSELASPTIGAAKTYGHAFAATGTFRYHCTIHTYMTGKVVVLAAGVTAPQTDIAVATSQGPDPQVVPVALLMLVGLGGALLGLRRLRTVA